MFLLCLYFSYASHAPRYLKLYARAKTYNPCCLFVIICACLVFVIVFGWRGWLEFVWVQISERLPKRHQEVDRPIQPQVKNTHTHTNVAHIVIMQAKNHRTFSKMALYTNTYDSNTPDIALYWKKNGSDWNKKEEGYQEPGIFCVCV